MKKRFVLALFILALLSACGEKAEDVVKNGILEFNSNITVGEALNGYKYFGSTKWSSSIDSEKRKKVEFVGLIDLEKLYGREINGVKISPNEIENLKKEIGDLKLSYIAQFVITDYGESFEIKYGCLRLSTTDKNTGKKLEQETPDKHFQVLKDFIYKNEPLDMMRQEE